MQIIIIDGWHKGQVIDWHAPEKEIKLLKPRTVTICDCDLDKKEIFDSGPEELVYRCAFRSEDGDVALFSTTGKSRDIFGEFIHAFKDHPYGRNETLTFGCHDEKGFK